MARFLFIYPNVEGYGRMSIGMVMTATVLKKHGHEVELFDTTFMDIDYIIGKRNIPEYKIASKLFEFKPVDMEKYGVKRKKVDVIAELKKKIGDFKPDVIAFSFYGVQQIEVYFSYEFGLRILKMAKLGKKIPVVAGGVKPTMAPEEILKEPEIDMVCIGEPEYAFLDLADRIDKKKNISTTKNFWIKKNSRIYKNKLRPLITNLDELPPGDFSIFDDKVFYRPYHGNVVRSIDYELARGCMLNCTYCVTKSIRDLYGKEAKNWRREKSTEKIIKEMKILKDKYRLDMVKFHDELFLHMPIKKLEELAKRYKTEVNLPFIIETSINSLTEQNIRLLKKMGCASISIGIESGNEDYRKKVLNKPIKDRRIIETFRLLRKYKMDYHTFNLLGLPYQNRKIIFETINLYRKAKIKSIGLNVYQPFYGSPLRELCLKEGFIQGNEELHRPRMGSVLKMQQLPQKELMGLMKTFQMYAYSPKVLWPLIKICEGNGSASKLIYRLLYPYFYIKLNILEKSH